MIYRQIRGIIWSNTKSQTQILTHFCYTIFIKCMLTENDIVSNIDKDS